MAVGEKAGESRYVAEEVELDGEDDGDNDEEEDGEDEAWAAEEDDEGGAAAVVGFRIWIRIR